ncbi:DNA-binding transcriptional regulator, GntR family [Propionibacterium cyclohexanicum]|uniref:DNA-binding transcriptional regulator, GntR family n=1 Tax=Propionibacterium cyclohexanicum TaxID=64702 RepID=A0A1H9SUL2_9ACTN|nr:GntR family transcriptional regulator [Propionibacterium cyclohexanicum]SER88646.1 DNA-binding transcriptional regulator, GntR family [Propionibacterium cyclohexanicum]
MDDRTTHFAVDVKIDRTSPVPLYFQISEPISKLIADGTLPPGTRLEDELSMASRLNVSRPTARKALQRLVDGGLVIRRRGVGTQVAPAQIHRPELLMSLDAELTRAGHETATQVLEYLVRPADDAESQELGLPIDTPVVFVKRLRFSDGSPIALLNNLIPASLAPRRAELESYGLYDILREHDVHLATAHQSIGAKAVGRVEAEQLGEQPGAAVLTLVRTTYDDRGGVVEFGHHVYRASRYTFDSTLFTR